MHGSGPESALLIPVPEAEPLVGQWRLEHDPSARAGVPPHVTLLYPFLPPDDITPGDLDELFARALGHDVALLGADLLEVVADILEGELLVVVTLGEPDEETGDASAGGRIDLAAHGAVLVDQPGRDGRDQRRIQLVGH